MSYNIVSNYLNKIDIKSFQETYTSNNNRWNKQTSSNTLNLYKAFIEWFTNIIRSNYYPYYTCITYNDLQKGWKGHSYVQDSLNKHYKLSILPKLVHRQRYHKYKDKHPLCIFFPERAPLQVSSFHLHGFIFLKQEQTEFISSENNRMDINNDFRNFCPTYNQEFYIDPNTNIEDIDKMTSYAMKKFNALDNLFKDEGYLFISN